MSKSPPQSEAKDPLLSALRQVPSRAGAEDERARARVQREARAAYLRSFEGSSWHGAAAGTLGRAAVPVFLAAIVGVYMTWAVVAAAALVH